MRVGDCEAANARVLAVVGENGSDQTPGLLVHIEGVARVWVGVRAVGEQAEAVVEEVATLGEPF